jgi:hypothetical protein
MLANETMSSNGEVPLGVCDFSESVVHNPPADFRRCFNRDMLYIVELDDSDLLR